jgi:hypothetical protein
MHGLTDTHEALPITLESFDEGAGNTPTPLDYYDAISKHYLIKNAAGRWLAHDLSSYKRILRSRGYRSKPPEGSGLSEIDIQILDVQNHRDVSYHGPLCGRNAGFYEGNGCRFLVTEDMQLPDPVKEDWRVLEQVLRGLLCKNEDIETGEAQFHTFCGWVKSSVEALRVGREQQQQALAICGPAGCGKSLIQHLITELLAGRSAKAERYFNGKTDFNADLFAAEHLILEDNHVSTRISDRLKLGASLKEHCVGVTTASLHAKGRTAINIRPWWRVSITLNDDSEAMMILPPLDDQTADKIILLRASRSVFPMPVTSSDEKHAFRNQLSKDIPAFIHWLLNEYEIPATFADKHRYNVATFHHPELKESLEKLSPESNLLEFIDSCFAEDFGRVEIKLTAKEIQKRLYDRDSRAAEKILSFNNAMGTYLGRLSKKRPERVRYWRTNTGGLWEICPPQKVNEPESRVSRHHAGDEEGVTP